MARSRLSPASELENTYLDDVAGGPSNAAGDESVEVDANEAQTTKEAEAIPSEDGSNTETAAPVSKGNGDTAKGNTGKPPKDTNGQAVGKNAADKTKPVLTKEETLQVYNTLKDRLQPVFHTLEKRANTAESQLKEASLKLDAYQNANQFAQKYELTPTEQLQSMQIMAAFKRDPSSLINYLVDKAHAAGHNVSIGNSAAPITPAAIGEMIKAQLAPVTREVDSRNMEQALRTEAETEVNQFFDEYPDARVHEDTLSKMIEKAPELSLHKALYKLREFYAAKGLDWNTPINVLEQQALQTPTQPRVDTKPMNVRGGTGVIRDNPAPDTGKVAPVTTSYRDIIRNEMRLAGLDTTNL